MKILMVNKFHYLKGGSEKYYFELANLLSEKGHKLAFFSMEDEKNWKTNFPEYFVPKIDLNQGKKSQAWNVISSPQNAEKMKQVLEEFEPDIVHINNFQRQLSASIIPVIKEKGIPIVFTAHDLQSICPAITMLDHEKKVCEKCKTGKYHNCIVKKCVKNSYLKSILAAIEARYYEKHKIYEKQIDFIITPSEFYRTKLIEGGISENKIMAIHNFIDETKYEVEKEDQGYLLYVGRLAKEKGILNLLQAFSKTKEGTLRIAGDGPEKQEVQEWIKKEKIENRVKLLGLLSQEEVTEEIRKARGIVIPSIWYENCPYSAIETLAIGKPVIGANIAGIPELVKEGHNGLLYFPYSIEELHEKMEILMQDADYAKKLGDQAKKDVYENYTKDHYYKRLIKIYTKLVEKK